MAPWCDSTCLWVCNPSPEDVRAERLQFNTSLVRTVWGIEKWTINSTFVVVFVFIPVFLSPHESAEANVYLAFNNLISAGPTVARIKGNPTCLWFRSPWCNWVEQTHSYEYIPVNWVSLKLAHLHPSTALQMPEKLFAVTWHLFPGGDVLDCSASIHRAASHRAPLLVEVRVAAQTRVGRECPGNTGFKTYSVLIFLFTTRLFQAISICF